MATIEWSFKLLSQKEATLFGALSVFSDAFEAEDAAFVAEAAGLSPVDVAASRVLLVKFGNAGMAGDVPVRCSARIGFGSR